MDISIVTSFYNGYGKYLERWLESIYQLETKPKKIIIGISGSKHGLNNPKKCISLLQKIGVPFKIIYIPKHKGMGFARNQVVRETSTKWVMYLDVDDTISPDAIDNLRKYQSGADVICGGLKIIGDRENEERLYPFASAEAILKGKVCCCSHGVYNRQLWQHSPYIEHNDFVDQPLWIGFAHLGAKFVPTNEVITVYHTSKEGHNLTMTEEDWKTAREQRREYIKNGINHPLKSYYFAHENNFGDMLTIPTLEYITNRKIQKVKADYEGKIVSCGSVLQRAVRKDDIIWGSGCMYDKELILPDNVKILAVRGPLTRKLIKNVYVPEVYGDPALLMPKIYNPKIEKKYDVGIIPHGVDKHLFKIQDNEKILFIDINNGDINKTIDQIKSCNVIISTSLHGIIVPEAYGINVVWIRTSDKIFGGNFKFNDYLLSTGRDMREPISMHREITDKDILSLSNKILPKAIINTSKLEDAGRLIL